MLSFGKSTVERSRSIERSGSHRAGRENPVASVAVPWRRPIKPACYRLPSVRPELTWRSHHRPKRASKVSSVGGIFQAPPMPSNPPRLRPGGNATGFMIYEYSLSAMRLGTIRCGSSGSTMRRASAIQWRTWTNAVSHRSFPLIARSLPTCSACVSSWLACPSRKSTRRFSLATLPSSRRPRMPTFTKIPAPCRALCS
jgi:hypothetical protein